MGHKIQVLPRRYRPPYNFEKAQPPENIPFQKFSNPPQYQGGSYPVFPTQWTNRNQVISIFAHVLSRLRNMMNIMNFVFGKLYCLKQTTLLLLYRNMHFSETLHGIKQCFLSLINCLTFIYISIYIFVSVWDKPGWLNWFWQFLHKRLSSF